MSIINTARARLTSVTNASLLRHLSVNHRARTGAGAIDSADRQLPVNTIPPTVSHESIRKSTLPESSSLSARKDELSAFGALQGEDNSVMDGPGLRASTSSSIFDDDDPVHLGLHRDRRPSCAPVGPSIVASCQFASNTSLNVGPPSSSSSMSLIASASFDTNTVHEAFSALSLSSSLASITSLRSLASQDVGRSFIRRDTALPDLPPATPATLMKLDQPAPLPESPLAHSRRAIPAPSMTFTATPFEYVFSAPLWEGLSAEMITAYAKRGDRLAVTVDAWHQEKDSHCEWEISFSPHDVDLTTTRVRLEAGGMLNITIRRNEEYSAEADPPVIRC